MKLNLYLAMCIATALGVSIAGLHAQVYLEDADGPTRLCDYDMPGLDQEVDMDTRVPTDVDDIIKFAAIKGNLNVVITTAVQGKVKLSLQKFASASCCISRLRPSAHPWRTR